MLSVGWSLKEYGGNLLDVTCNIHALNLMTQMIPKCHSQLNALIAHTTTVFLPKHTKTFHELCMYESVWITTTAYALRNMVRGCMILLRTFRWCQGSFTFRSKTCQIFFIIFCASIHASASSMLTCENQYNHEYHRCEYVNVTERPSSYGRSDGAFHTTFNFASLCRV